MKKLLFLVLSLACLNLEATHYTSKLSVTPTSEKNEFLLGIKIEKICDGCSVPELIASPELLCCLGGTTKITMGPEESGEEEAFLWINAAMPANESSIRLECSIVLKEEGKIVLSHTQILEINN